MTFLLKSSHTRHISHSLHLLITVEQTSNRFNFVLLQSESNIFLIAQLTGRIKLYVADSILSDRATKEIDE